MNKVEGQFSNNLIEHLDRIRMNREKHDAVKSHVPQVVEKWIH